MDFQALLKPLDIGVAGEGICVEYDVEYLELDSLASGIPNSIMGDSIVEGKESDWQKLRDNCMLLWNSTRDLRVATYLSVASLCIEGLSGFRDGLKVIKYLVDNHWENFWPNLDPMDDNDPTERINIISMLSPRQGSYNDPLMFISRFRDVKLFNDKGYTLRDYMNISNELDPSEKKVSAEFFNAEMLSFSLAVMKERLDVTNEIISILKHISEVMNTKMKDKGSVSFDALNCELKVLVKFYSSYVSSGESILSDEKNLELEVDGRIKNSDSVRYMSTMNIKDYIPLNRSDALILLRKSADYFRKTEPTNPVPYILERALRIAGMNFVDILSEISPDSVARVREQLGVMKDS